MDKRLWKSDLVFVLLDPADEVLSLQLDEVLQAVYRMWTTTAESKDTHHTGAEQGQVRGHDVFFMCAPACANIT